MGMTRAVIRCKDCEGLIDALIPWLQERGVSALPRVYITANANANTDVWWNLFVPGNKDSANLAVSSYWSVELTYEDPTTGRAKEVAHEVCMIHGINETGEYAEEVVRALLSKFGGFYTESPAKLWGLHGQVASEDLWVKCPMSELESKAEPVLCMSWKELFKHFGNVVQTTDCENWKEAAREFQTERKRAGATSVFKDVESRATGAFKDVESRMAGAVVFCRSLNELCHHVIQWGSNHWTGPFDVMSCGKSEKGDMYRFRISYDFGVLDFVVTEITDLRSGPQGIAYEFSELEIADPPVVELVKYLLQTVGGHRQP